MKHLLILFLLTISAITFGQTQYEMNQEQGKKYETANSILNNIYKKILNEYSGDTAFIKNLKTAEQLWIRFRDAELKMKFPDSYQYGSIQPMCVSMYLTDLTNDRIKTLQTWLEGIEEGDGCSGSVKMKH